MSDTNYKQAEQGIAEFLKGLGRHAHAEPELQHTAERVASAFADELLTGYQQDPAQLLAEQTNSSSNAMVVLKHVRVFPICPHHLLPNPGLVSVAYLPATRVIGLGQLARLVYCYSRRLILVEDLVASIAESLITHVGCTWAACAIDAEPLCVSARGSRATQSRIWSFHVAGPDRDNARYRADFWQAINQQPA